MFFSDFGFSIYGYLLLAKKSCSHNLVFNIYFDKWLKFKKKASIPRYKIPKKHSKM